MTDELERLQRRHTFLLRLWIERPADNLHEALAEVRTLERQLVAAAWAEAAPTPKMTWW